MIVLYMGPPKKSVKPLCLPAQARQVGGLAWW